MPESLIDVESKERLQHYVSTVQALYRRSTAQGKEPRNTYLLCDDTAYNDQFMRCAPLKEVFLNGRNFNMTCILVLQYLMKVGPDLRGNADFVFVFWDSNRKNQEKIWQFWFNMMPKKVFEKVFFEVTQNYSCLVMDVRRSATSRDWHDCVFWYKSKLPNEIPSFSMCDQDFFELDKYCKARDVEERQVKNSAQERVWMLGPDGQICGGASTMQTVEASNVTYED